MNCIYSSNVNILNVMHNINLIVHVKVSCYFVKLHIEKLNLRHEQALLERMVIF